MIAEAQRVKWLARACGFDAVGIAAAQILEPERTRYLRWIAEGRHGSMRWLTTDWATRASDPHSLLPSARSVVCVALSYGGRHADHPPAGYGRVARYAWGRDYHGILRERLDRLTDEIGGLGGETRAFVDTAPTMDKALAARAGLGWQGRNTNLLNRSLGSFTFLGGIITDLALKPDTPVADGCGACRLCAVACPTGALDGDYHIDARRCISYLTIEHRGPIPRELRPLIGDWVYGCDVCQDVCPVVTDIQDSAWPDQRPARIEFVRAAVRATRARD